MELEINKIMLDGGTQPRAQMDFGLVAEYVEVMREGDKFPDVIVFYDGSQYWLADGFHRVRAALDAGLKVINADVKQGTRRDAILYSVGANARHGGRRKNEDKRRAVRTLLEDSEWQQWTDREIARQCKVTHPFVGKLRSELNHTGNYYQYDQERVFTHPKTGKPTTMNTTNIGHPQKALNLYHLPPLLNGSLDTTPHPPLRQKELDYTPPEKHYHTETIIYPGGHREEIIPQVPDSLEEREKILQVADKMAEDDLGLTAEEWDEKPDEYLGHCFKQCYGAQRLIKGHVLEYGTRGVYVCTGCGYAYPPNSEPGEVTFSYYVDDPDSIDRDELEWLIEDWVTRFGPCEETDILLAQLEMEKKESERDEQLLSDYEKWEAEQMGLGPINRGIWLDPFIADPEVIEKTIKYLMIYYHKKTGKPFLQQLF